MFPPDEPSTRCCQQELVLKVERTNGPARVMYEALGYRKVHSKEGMKLLGDSTFGKTVAVEHVYLQRLFTPVGAAENATVQ